MAEIFDLSVTDASNTGRWPEGMALSSVNNAGRANEGMQARHHKDVDDSVVTTGGSSTAYTISANRTIASYHDGLTQRAQIHTASGATPTLNIDSVGAKDIYFQDGTQVTTNDLPANAILQFVFDSGNDHFKVDSPTVGASNVINNSLLTTRGDMIRRGASAPERFAIGADNTLLTSDGTDPGWETLTSLLDAALSSTQGVVLYRGASAWAALAVGTSGQFLQTQGAAANPQWASPAFITRETQQATTSGTAFDFTGIASGANRITVMIEEGSLDASNDDMLIQIGDSGGLETTGYISTSLAAANGAGSSGTSSTSGFVMFVQNSAAAVSAVMTLVRIDGNSWVASHSGKISATQSITGGGSKTLSAELDRLRLTRSGSDNYDAGNVNLLVE